MTTSPTPDRVTALYDAIDAFQREHRTSNGLGHAQIRALLAEHLDRALPAVVSSPPATDRATVLREAADLITERQALLETEERADIGDLDLETIQQGTAVRRMASYLRSVADKAQPSEAEAAATHARGCLDRPAVIRWCADRVRSTDGDYAIQAAAEYLDDLATEAEEARQPEPELSGDLIEDYLRHLRGLGPQPDLSGLTPEQREAAAGQFEIVKALADRGPELPPLDRDPVALRLGLLAEAPAAECSAQHHAFDDARLCIRAGQHRGDHIDERGFHWSDTVAVYPVADGTFRSGVRQPDTETPDRAAVYQALADDYEQLIADGKFAGLQDVVTHLRGLAGGAGGVADETAGEASCRKTRSVSGHAYQPCALPPGHPEAYCQSADGMHLFLAEETSRG